MLLTHSTARQTVGRDALHGNSSKTRGSNEMVGGFGDLLVVRSTRNYTLVTPKYLLIKVRQHSSSELKVD